MTVVATAGHVDHGKSTLVQHLTGTDPDRWKEEKARGLTIDLGFASATLPSGRRISFIDVPGHIKFLRNMLSGVGAIDGCVFVVSAVEGWKPQSEEHLQILELLGIQRGIIAITKADLVDDDLLELAKMETEDRVAGTFLANAPIIGTSTQTGIGFTELQTALDAHIPDDVDQDRGRPRLWVDRSFSPKGAGAVVTGTLTEGRLKIGDEIEFTPSNVSARIRSMQNHNTKQETVDPGNRVAVNLTGVDHNEIRRGDCLITSGQWHLSAKVDAQIRVLDSLDHSVDRRGAYFVYIGSAELSAKIQILGGQELEPGSTGKIRLYLDRVVPAQPGDRFILRESGRNETVGGGHFLDVDPLLPTTKANPEISTERLVKERGWAEAAHLSKIAGELVEPTVGRWVVDPKVRSDAEAELRRIIEAAGDLGFDIAALSEQQRALVELDQEMVVTGTAVTIGEPTSDLDGHPWLSQLRAAGFSPPGADEVNRGEIRQLIQQNLVIERDGIFFATSTVEEAAVLLAGGFLSNPDGMTVSEIRDLWSTSRKYALALLAEMDATGMTRRRENIRIPGPRLPNNVN